MNGSQLQNGAVEKKLLAPVADVDASTRTTNTSNSDDFVTTFFLCARFLNGFLARK